MFILTIFILTFKERNTFITIWLTNLDLGFRVKGWDMIFGMWSLIRVLINI